MLTGNPLRRPKNECGASEFLSEVVECRDGLSQRGQRASLNCADSGYQSIEDLKQIESNFEFPTEPHDLMSAEPETNKCIATLILRLPD